MAKKKKAPREALPPEPYYKTVDFYTSGTLECRDNRHTPEEIREKGPVAVYLYRGVTEIETGFFETFPTVMEVSIPHTVQFWEPSPAEKALFQQNGTTLVGIFDSRADQLARELGLPFLHREIQVAWDRNEAFEETNVINLKFTHGGRPYLHQNCIAVGMSASSSGGGENSVDLPLDFYRTMTQDEIADLCWPFLRGQVRSDEDLRTFLAKAKARGGYRRG